MMQALLEYRFKLRVHRESVEAPAYALVVAEGDHKLEATQAGSCTPVDLKLESIKDAMEVLVIDHVERPTGN